MGNTCSARSTQLGQPQVKSQKNLNDELHFIEMDPEKIYDLSSQIIHFNGNIYDILDQQHEAQHKLQGTKYLFHEIHPHTINKGFFDLLKKQVFILNDYHGIQKVHEIYYDRKCFTMIKENVSHISLQDFIGIQKKCLKEVQIISIFYQILRIVDQLNKNGLTHGKLTTGSFVIQFDDVNAYVQLIDLISSHLSETHNKEQIIYASPQMCRYNSQGDTTNRSNSNSQPQFGSNVEDDVWSCGMILKELIDFELPQRNFDFQRIQTYVKKAVFMYSSHHMDRVSQELKQLLQKCLKLNVKERITLQEALKIMENMKKKFVNTNNTKQIFSKFQNMQKLSQFQMDILFKLIITHMEKQYQEWTIIFNECDTNFDGSVDYEELINYLTQLYPKNANIKTDVQQVFKKLHSQGEQKLSQKEFIVGMIDKRQLPKEAVSELFKSLQPTESVIKSSDFNEISEVNNKDIVKEFKAYFKANKITPKHEDQMSLHQFELYCRLFIQ